MENFNPENRVPMTLARSGNELRCRWMNTYEKRFTEPFFYGTIRNLQFTYPENRDIFYSTSLRQMQQEAHSIAALSPSVIVFHMSRCGSTLVTQLFATSERFIVLSEVSFFDDLLRLPFTEVGFDKANIPALLSSSLRFYGRKRSGAEEHLVIKTDCWHIFFYDILRTMFPSVPFVLMYRNPGEVLRSLAKKPGRQVTPHEIQPEIFGLSGIPEQYDRGIYTAMILEKMLAKFLEVAETDKNCLPVNYNEGALTVVKQIAGLANIELSSEETGIMEQRSYYHSKNPGELFSEEPAADVPECLREAMRLYEALEQKRKMTQIARGRPFPPAV